ncbi:MAG: class I SAM-dependent methyltransferase [Angustibacter sp.]
MTAEAHRRVSVRPRRVASRVAARAVRGVAGRLSAPRRDATLALARAARDLARGRVTASPRPSNATTRDLGFSLPVLPKLPPSASVPPVGRWATAPPIDRSWVVDSAYETGPGATVYDVDLLEELNAEYADKPLVPKPRSYQTDKLGRASLYRVRQVHREVDLKDTKVLEIGCSNGYEVWTMAHNLGCDAYGVDVNQLHAWEHLRGDRVHFTQVDLTEQQPFEYGTFDRIVSFTVWEHVVRPFELLDETYKLLKPGGRAWIQANLYAGPKASHRYRDIFFPWPHLLFSDDVVRAWDVKHGRPPKGLSWVNRLSWEHYARHLATLGFHVRSLRFKECEWDEEFYQRFSNVLGRFPKEDLKRDFFTVVLEKPR